MCCCCCPLRSKRSSWPPATSSALVFSRPPPPHPFSPSRLFSPLAAAAQPTAPPAAPPTLKKPRFAAHLLTSTIIVACWRAVRVWRVFWPCTRLSPFSAPLRARCCHLCLSFPHGYPVLPVLFVPCGRQLLAFGRNSRHRRRYSLVSRENRKPPAWGNG